jgi:protein ATS1
VKIRMAFFALGSNGSGQLGIGHDLDVSVPKPVLLDTHPSTYGTPQVRAGGNHTLLLFPSGHLYCSGDAENGACGPRSHLQISSHSFHPVVADPHNPGATPIRDAAFCAATWESSVVVRRDDQGRATQVYSFGLGNKGELGLGEFIFRTPAPQLIKNFPPQGTEVIDLAGAVNHVVAVLSNGDVYGWGNGRKGQLGEPSGILHDPRKVEGLEFKATRAVCGREFTYLVGDPAEGESVVLGSDKWNIISRAPSSILGWKDIGAGWGNIFVLLEDGKLLSWGRDDHGQLGPESLPQISKIAIGSEHAVLLAADGNVLAWGWGEHGNCGPDTIDGDVKGKANIIAASQNLQLAKLKVSAIGAGCATSWIWTEQA